MTPKRIEMGREIVRFEGRYKDGKLQVYYLPAEDGGGAYEIAGINDRYHPKKAKELRDLIEEGKHKQAEDEAAIYIEEYTRSVLKFFPSPELADANPAIEFVLRDSCFNRGPKGAATILQHALGMEEIDGIVGPATRAEFARQLVDPGPVELLEQITQARETYERNVYPWKPSKRDESSKFWKGLSSRWDKAHSKAQNFA
jgi:lysozyme family protein